MLGLDQPFQNQPSMEALRERAFSGHSFLEPEEPKAGGRRILLMIVLMAALGGSGWWTYSNLTTPETRKAATTTPSTNTPSANTSTADEGSDEKPAMKSTVSKPTVKEIAPTPDAGSQPAAPPAVAAERPSENASTGTDSASKSQDTTGKPAVETATATPGTAVGSSRAEKREPIRTSAKAITTPAPAETDTGDDAFRKGEAYLYGRGVHESCNDAVRYLKAASSKSNPKARSAFGTMYATGHCVSRDLPTSYLWFAMALQVDPNNQILEKDLNAVWNQMTPPERQMATRMKQ
jgi:hypothetical protein